MFTRLKQLTRFMVLELFTVLKNTENPANRANSVNSVNFFIFTLFATLFFVSSSEARVTGPCYNCHTMHNSQNGQPVNRGDSAWGEANVSDNPIPNLLVASCLGCHSSSDGQTIKTLPGGLKVPIVFNTNGYPAGALAGGNFYWVSPGVASNENDAKGHNVFSGNPDNNLNEAPGDPRSGSCGGSTACHKNLHSSTPSNSFGFESSRQGCTKCHMIGSALPKGYHHLNSADAVKGSASDGWFRFLSGHQAGSGHGVSGIEDNDWQYTSSSNDHNEYLGYSGNKTADGGFSALADTVTAFCTGCHAVFHSERNSADNVWIRHPSDSIIPDSGEFANAFNGGYDPLVPVARPNLSGWAGPVGSVTLGSGGDLVMCLSCHRAHGSPYSKLMRWDYKGWPGNGQTNGCNVCHTAKN
ncbi:MAG: cytochrome c3 family protein [Thermodesulfovibrionales bacterium]